MKLNLFIYIQNTVLHMNMVVTVPVTWHVCPQQSICKWRMTHQLLGWCDDWTFCQYISKPC